MTLLARLNGVMGEHPGLLVATGVALFSVTVLAAVTTPPTGEAGRGSVRGSGRAD